MAQVSNAATFFALLSIAVICYCKPSPSEIDPRCENMFVKKYEVIMFSNEQVSNFLKEISGKKAELNIEELYRIHKRGNYKFLFKVQTDSEDTFLDIVKRLDLKLKGPDCS